MTRIVAIIIVLMVAICAIAIAVVMDSVYDGLRVFAGLILIIPAVLFALLVLFTIPILFHELGHALVAKIFGYGVHSLSFGPFVNYARGRCSKD